MLSADQIANIRVATLAATGIVCLTYAVLALYLGRPDPMPWWIPMCFGLGAGVAITLSAWSAGRDVAGMAMDEGYAMDSVRAQAQAYWIALFLYPLFAVLLGTLTGAAYLLLFVWHDLRGRG